MKNITVLFISFLLMLSCYVTAQTAEGGCTDVTVTDIPPYPTVYFAYVGYKNCKDGGGYYEGCDEDGRPACCRIITFGSPTTPRFWLEQIQDDGSWLEVEGPQFSITFSDVDKGTYRVKCQVPTIAENACGKDPFGNVIKARMCLFNLLGQFIGYWGTWDNSPYGTTPPTYSNTVVVGATTAEDISYTFVDIPETGSEQAYDFGETAIMYVSDSRDYDLWWLAIFEDGPTFNRFKSNGWTSGSKVPNDEFNLTEFWANGTEWQFETFHSYMVQFVIENRKCRNGIEQIPPTTWNNLDRTFFICPAGSGCRFGVNEKEIVISPNPANGVIRLQNFEPDLDGDYLLTITDMAGRLVKTIPLTTDRVDISDLQRGMFVVSILKEDNQVFNAKLVVNY